MKQIVLVFLTTLLFQNSAVAEDPSSILKKSDLRRGLQGSFSVQVRTVSTDGTEKQTQVYDVKVLNHKVSLVEQVEPASAKGRKLLMNGYDMWLFTPDIKRSVRISLQQRLTGEVQNGDIVRTNFSEDYDAQIDRSAQEPGYHVLDLKAKEAKVTYERIRYWVEKKTYRPHRAEFFASGGKKLKDARFGKFRKIGGMDRMTHVLIVDALNNKRKSEMFYSAHKKQKYDEGIFNKEQMDR